MTKAMKERPEEKLDANKKNDELGEDQEKKGKNEEEKLDKNEGISEKNKEKSLNLLCKDSADTEVNGNYNFVSPQTKFMPEEYFKSSEGHRLGLLFSFIKSERSRTE